MNAPWHSLKREVIHSQTCGGQPARTHARGLERAPMAAGGGTSMPAEMFETMRTATALPIETLVSRVADFWV
jgi:hypothetical protein